MCLHVVAVGLYLAAGIGFYTSLLNYLNADSASKTEANNYVIISLTVVCFLSFLAQLCQVIIFRQLATEDKEVTTTVESIMR